MPLDPLSLRPLEPAPAASQSSRDLGFAERSLARFAARFEREPGSDSGARQQPEQERSGHDDAANSGEDQRALDTLAQQALLLAQNQQVAQNAPPAPQQVAQAPARVAQASTSQAAALHSVGKTTEARAAQPVRASRSTETQRDDDRSSTTRGEDRQQPDDDPLTQPLAPTVNGAPQIFTGINAPQRQSPDEDRRQRKGALAQLIEELVDCLQMSEDALPGDWDIRLRLKEHVFPQTDLHMQRQGGRLTLAFRSGDDATLALLTADADAVRDRLSALSEHGAEVLVLSM